MTLQDLLEQLREEVHKVERRAEKAEGDLATLPRTTLEVDATLRELADAERDCDDHIRVRYPNAGPYEKQSEECRADWHRCCRRRDDVVARLVRYALAIHPPSQTTLPLEPAAE